MALMVSKHNWLSSVFTFAIVNKDMDKTGKRNGEKKKKKEKRKI